MSGFTSSFQLQDSSTKQNIDTDCVPAFMMSVTSQGLGGGCYRHVLLYYSLVV